MRLAEVHFKQTVTFRGSEQGHLQATKPDQQGSYAPALRVADGAVWWSEDEGAPVSCVRQWTRASAKPVEPEAKHPEVAPEPPKNVEAVTSKKGKNR